VILQSAGGRHPALSRALAAAQGQKVAVWVEAHEFQRYFGSSLKGETDMDWDDEQARNAFLRKIVADARRLMQLAREKQASLNEKPSGRKADRRSWRSARAVDRAGCRSGRRAGETEGRG